MNNKLSKSSLQTHTDTLEIYNLLRNTNISEWRIEQDQMCASWYLIMLHRSRWYASEKGVVYGITCSCNRVKIWKKVLWWDFVWNFTSHRVFLESKVLKSGHCRIFIKKHLFSRSRMRKPLKSGQKWCLRPFSPLIERIFGQGVLGVKEDFQGVPWGHWVGLMGFLLIHISYLPWYKWSGFLARDVRVDGSTRGSISGPRGPK